MHISPFIHSYREDGIFIHDFHRNYDKQILQEMESLGTRSIKGSNYKILRSIRRKIGGHKCEDQSVEQQLENEIFC